MKFLITNSVPLNGGDEALLRATVESICDRDPTAEITILCSKDLALCKQQVPDLNLNYDLECAPDNDRDFTSKVKRKVASILRKQLSEGRSSQLVDVLEGKGRRDIIALYRDTDIVISSPGGFLHDFYSVSRRLDGFALAVDLGKPIVIFAQSVGPFWKPESIKKASKVLNRLSAICVRDEISVKYLTDIGVRRDNIYVTADAAFLWHQLAPELFQSKPTTTANRIGLCFRVWPLNSAESFNKTADKAVELCKSILADPSKSIGFVSTCQGIDGYVDDSQLALQILDRLPDDMQHRCDIDRDRYEPRALMKKLSDFDAFISMRLHGCILAMLSGTPAMGLGYEDKTEQVFHQLNLGNYQVGFDRSSADWIVCKDRFLDDIDKIHKILPDGLRRNCLAASQNLDIIDDVLTKVTFHKGVSA